MSDVKSKNSYSTFALISGILALVLTIAFSSLCVVLDLTGVLSRSLTAGLVFVGLIFGIIGLFISNMSYSTKHTKRAVAGLILSIVSVIACVYSFILYLDMLYWWTNILNAVSPGLLG